MTIFIRGKRRPRGDDVEVEYDPDGSSPITRAQYDLSLFGVASEASVKLPFVFNYGTELLDLTDPTNPTPFESGKYSFSTFVNISDVAADGKWGVVVTLDEDDFGVTMSDSKEITQSDGQIAITFPFFVPAGSPCHVRVNHQDSDGANFSGHVYVQRDS